MHHRIRIAVLGSALAVAAAGFAAPAAVADEGDSNTTVDKVVVNGGKPIVVGTTAAKTFKVSVTASDDSGIKEGEITLFGPNSAVAQPNAGVKCVSEGATTSTCTASFTLAPSVDFYDNTPAGTWYVDTLVSANDDDQIWSEKAAAFKVQRQAKLTVNASPEPVKKGRTLTITGALTRANWETSKYSGYTGQSVTLEFRKKGATSYTAVKTVKSGTKGALKTTVKASVDGDWRYSYAGNSSTSAGTATADFVDVR